MKNIFILTILIIISTTIFSQSTAIILPKTATEVKSIFKAEPYIVIDEEGKLSSLGGKNTVKASVICNASKKGAEDYIIIMDFENTIKATYNRGIESSVCCFAIRHLEGGTLASWTQTLLSNNNDTSKLYRSSLRWEGVIGSCYLNFDVDFDAKSILTAEAKTMELIKEMILNTKKANLSN